MMTKTTRNGSVLAVLTVASALLSFVGGLALLFSGSLGGAFGATGTGLALTLGAAMFAVGLVGFLVGYGFWAVLPWARRGAIVLYSVSVAVHAASVVFAGASVVTVVVPVAVAAAVIWFLFKPETKAAYRRTA